MNGASASLARRREISVLPTPVGPIIRMFFGSTSSRSLSSSWSLRQRLRSAIATARVASWWPTRQRSSSETISQREKSVTPNPVAPSQLLDHDVAIGVDADVGRDRHGLAGDRLGVELAVEQSAGRRQRVIAAGPYSHRAAFRLEHVAGAGEHQRNLLVGDDHHGFEPPQVAVGAPVLGEFDRRAGELAGILLELGLEPLEQREGVGGRAGEARDDLALAEAAHLLGVRLDDGLPDAHLAVARDDDRTVLADGQDGGGVPACGFGRGHRPRRAWVLEELGPEELGPWVRREPVM